MTLYRCTVKCYWRRQLWRVGDTAGFTDGQSGEGVTPPAAFFAAIEGTADNTEPLKDAPVKSTKRRKRTEEDGNDGSGGGEQSADTAGSGAGELA